MKDGGVRGSQMGSCVGVQSAGGDEAGVGAVGGAQDADDTTTYAATLGGDVGQASGDDTRVSGRRGSVSGWDGS
jgi:hypothetical protein